MSFLLRLLVSTRKMSGALYVFAFFSMGSAQAITINFDDLEPGSFLEGDSFNPPFNQIGSLGVIFEGYVQPISGSTKSSPNFLWGSVGFSMYFIDVLPTYVSMYVGSPLEHKVGIRAHGANGYFEDRLTDGGVRGINWESSTPYRPNQFISFYIPEGISSINMGGHGGVYVDDLTFTSSPPAAVAEPSVFILFCLGVLGLALRRRKIMRSDMAAFWSL